MPGQRRKRERGGGKASYTRRREGRVPTATVESISRWVDEGYPDWRRWRRSWRTVLPVLVCFGTAEELWLEFGLDPVEIRGDVEHCGSSFVLEVLRYYMEGLYPRVERIGVGGGLYELSPGEIAARLLYEEGLLASRRVLLGKGSTDDRKLVERAGLLLPLEQAVKDREHVMEREKDRPRGVKSGPLYPFPDPTAI